MRKAFWIIRNNNLILILRKFLIKKKYNKKNFFLNVGGFIFIKKNWRVLEFSSESYPISKNLIDYNVNLSLNKELPLLDEQVNLIYTSHTLEHLLESSVIFNIREIYRILKKDGMFRIVVPDIDIIWEACHANDLKILNYLGKRKDQSIPEFFLYCFSIKRADDIQLKKDFYNLDKKDFLKRYQTSSIDNKFSHDYSNHISWFNFEKMKNILLDSGFKEEKIYKSSFLKSNSEEMRESKFFDKTLPKISLFVECIK